MIDIGTKLCAKGVWDQQPTPDGRLDILLNPSFAFGIAHPTTIAVLQEMETLIAGGEVVLDIGTGTGILAIAAIRLGAAHVWAVDSHRDAIAAVNANIASNGMEASINVIGDTWPQRLAVPVDLAVMNIDNTGLIDAVLSQLDLTATGTFIVVVDTEDRTPVEAVASTAGLTLVRSRPAGTYMRGARDSNPIIFADALGRSFQIEDAQQQAQWTALVFGKGGP